MVDIGEVRFGRDISSYDIFVCASLRVSIYRPHEDLCLLIKALVLFPLLLIEHSKYGMR